MNRVSVSTGLIVCLALFSCQQKPAPPTPPVPVNLYTVTAQPALYYDRYPSTAQALSQVNVLPQVQGYITKVFVADGSQGKKGQPLYEIDVRLFQSAYEQSVANLNVTKSTLAQAQQDADRYEYLNSYKAVAKQQYDHAMIALQTAKDQVKASEEAVKTAKTNLSYALITAPFDGTVGFSQVKLGNMVTPGQTVLNTVSTNNPMAVDFLLNEKQLPAFEKLEKDKFANADSIFTFLLPDNSPYPYPGKISVIDRAVDPQTGTIRVRLVFPNPKNDLKVGMSCVVRVRNQETTPQMFVPTKGIVEQMGEYFVFLAKDTILARSPDSTATDKTATDKKEKVADSVQGPKLRAFQRKVKLGQTIGANVIVLSGIDIGDKVVVDGIQAIHEGSPISTKGNSASPANGTAPPKSGKAGRTRKSSAQ
jgi:RND family efflux transporter MFP subunit